MTMEEAALAYARRGWAVFPLGVRSKEPLVRGAYKAATADVAQVRIWWQQWPEANIGLATGRVSGLWVLDIDGEQGEASFAQLVAEHGGELAETRMASSGKGYHLYWRLPFGTDQGRRIGVRPGIDIIGGQGYLVAPPSVHPSGRVYQWLNEHQEPVEAPQWLMGLERVRSAPKPLEVASAVPIIIRPTSRPEGPVRDPQSYLRGVTRSAAASVARAAQGTRNHELFKQACWAVSVAAGLRLDDTVVLRDLWRAAQMAGLEELEIERTLQSAMDKGRANPAQVGNA